MFTLEKDVTEYFDFRIGKKIYKVPALKSLPYEDYMTFVGVLRSDGDEMKNVDVTNVIVGIFEKYAPGCTDGLTVSQVAQLVGAYTNGNEELGE